jgi:nucleoside-diphosphate-sugar epimerase
MTTAGIRTAADLEQELARPSAADIACMRRLEGDILVLGASGKMGPSLARLCRRAADESGRARRVFAVSRHAATEPGIEAIPCDLLRRAEVAGLPECANILYLAGRKFGSSGNPELTWAINTVVPALVAERFPRSRMVVFSTGNVYPFRPLAAGGSVETDSPAPVGEYAQSCLGRERVFEHYSRQSGLACLLFRLNYAVDLRYGVLVDVARKVWSGEPVDVRVPAFNAIWQRDANSYALRALEFTAAPPRILNVTGAETIAVRQAAEWFACRFRRAVHFTGKEGAAALLSNASECHRLLGRPEVAAEHLMEMVAAWIESGGALLEKPTQFEVADGRF